ncbi:MAG TPA: MtrB/PioB family outer membrane beta-barrel protein [Smithella sp.]|nr:MtrB/PioB family outer membrane beta-barrel protein [Smithella sp.]
MKKPVITLSLFIFGLAFLSPAFAEDEKISGDVAATGVLVHVDGNKAKFNEYNDTQSGIYDDINIKYDSDKYYADFYNRNIFYNTQSYGLEAGKWGAYKLDIHYDEIPHNFTDDAKTLYSGAGTANLTYPTHPPSTNTNNWNTFDYSTKRRDMDADFKIDLMKPFFLDISAASEKKTGTYAIGAAGTTPGGISIELPAPVNYTTDSFSFMTGYVKNPVFISLGYFYSSFNNSDANLNFRNPATANTAGVTDTYCLPPDNTYYRINLKSAVKLPLNTKVNLDLATANTRSDALLGDSYVADVAGGLRFITTSSPFFHGDVDTNNISTSVTSRPLSFFDAKLFFKYDTRENKSDTVVITDAAQTPATFTNDLFSYRRAKYGTELGFQLPEQFYLSANYNHATISRERDDIPDNRDDVFGVDLRWKGVDFLVARVGYERLDRWANFQQPSTLSFDTFVGRFDADAKTRNTFKGNLDISPVDDLSISLGYKHKETVYNNTILGLTGEKGDEFMVDADYLINKRIRLFASFDYEHLRLDQFQRQATAAGSPDPSTPPTSTAFNWTAAQNNDNYSYMAGTELYVIPDKFTLRLQYSYLRAKGSVDYTYLLGANPLPAGRTQDNIDLNDWDSYKLTSILIKLSYNLTKKLSIASGYAYEKYDYSDAQYDGYTYVPAVTTTNGAYLTGAYNNPSYESSLVFVTLSYHF